MNSTIRATVRNLKCPFGKIFFIPAGICRQYRARRARALRQEPPACSDPSIRYIPLTQGKFAIVDAEDYERVSRYNWCVSAKANTIYAYRKDHGKNVYLHRFLMQPPPGMVVDHIDGNGLNDRKSNLRICDRRQNQLNCGPRVRSSRFKGVHFCKWTGTWYARIVHAGHTIRLGPFEDEVEAARAYDRKAYELFGEYAYLNFPQETREEAKRKEGKGKGAEVEPDEPPDVVASEAKASPLPASRLLPLPSQGQACGAAPNDRKRKA